MSLEAEAAVLGHAMLDRGRADEMLDGIVESDLTREAHRILYRYIAQLRDEGETPDLVTVTDRLGREGWLDEVGGSVALADLIEAPFGPVEQWCRQIRNASRRRHASQVFTRRNAQLAEATDVDALLEDTIEDLLGGTSSTVGTVDPSQVMEGFTRRLESGNPQEGWELEWRQTDYFRIPQNGLTIVTGLPSHGKSTWVDVCMVGMLRKHPQLKVGFFSPEMAPAENHLYELVRTSMGTDPEADPPQAGKWAEFLLSRCHWIDDSRHSSPAAVIAQARRLVRNEGIQVLVIDPYNNLEPDAAERGDRQDLYIQALLRRLRRFAREAGIAVIVVAHPRNTDRILGTDAVYRVPQGSDISGGAEWRNHADMIVTVWRNASGEEPEEYGPPCDSLIVVSKCRFQKWGRTGKATLTFNERARRYQ